MNVKDIKAMRWHKKSLITIMKKAGINIEDIIKRRDEDLVTAAHAAGVTEGYKNGYTDGRFLGYSDGWSAAQVKYTKGY